MTITYHPEIEQGSSEWYEIRQGIFTASEMNLLLTPTLKIASNDKTRSHLYELAAQRITKFVEPSYVSDAMLRGRADEVTARGLYSANFWPVDECGFITNDKFGFTIGYSPDGLVGDDGLIECKSRAQKYQLETILSLAIPAEHILQLQTGLLVSERQWIDYVSYCGGMNMIVIRMYQDAEIHAAIEEATTKAETAIRKMVEDYLATINEKNIRTVPTQRGNENDE